MATQNILKESEILLLLTDIVQRLNRSYRPDKIILYGSYAYGNPTSDSDIDLLIIKDTDKRSVDRFVEVKQIIYKPGRSVPISPLVYTPKELEDRLKMGDDFLAEIMARGKILYAR
jgi:predicted nucleotidyltransferase